MRRFPKMAEVIADELRARMGKRELVEGDFLPNERVLTEEFEVSRPTLREAMRILEAEGLITSPRGGSKGARVRTPSTDIVARNAGLILQIWGTPVADIYRLYTFIEPGAARMMAERKDRDAGELRRLLSEMSKLIDHPRDYARILQQFDRTLMAGSGNKALNLVGQMMAYILRLHLSTIPETLSGLPSENIRGMKRGPDLLNQVVDAIEAGDGPVAEQLMRARALQNEDWHRRRTSERVSVVN
jgi:DNA-binding FadR family transcriptional regulator